MIIGILDSGIGGLTTLEKSHGYTPIANSFTMRTTFTTHTATRAKKRLKTS